MRHVALCVCVLTTLAGCGFQQTDRFRDTSQVISASSRFDPEAFSGQWLIVATFGPARRAPVSIIYVPEAQHFRVASDAVPQIAGLYRAGRPGELLPLSEDGSPLVVMWVDEDFETAVIGTPSGSFGAVLDRDGEVPADRARAARDILEFNGWDVAALTRTRP